jgi:hypothetical protein
MRFRKAHKRFRCEYRLFCYPFSYRFPPLPVCFGPLARALVRNTLRSVTWKSFIEQSRLLQAARTLPIVLHLRNAISIGAPVPFSLYEPSFRAVRENGGPKQFFSGGRSPRDSRIPSGRAERFKRHSSSTRSMLDSLHCKSVKESPLDDGLELRIHVPS